MAVAFAAEDANVVLTDLRQEGMDETLGLMEQAGSGQGATLIADAGKAEDHDRAVELAPRATTSPVNTRKPSTTTAGQTSVAPMVTRVLLSANAAAGKYRGQGRR